MAELCGLLLVRHLKHISLFSQLHPPALLSVAVSCSVPLLCGFVACLWPGWLGDTLTSESALVFPVQDLQMLLSLVLWVELWSVALYSSIL